MQIYLPIAELPVSILTILAMGAVVGFLSGMFGIGGGFLMTPLLIFLGIPPAVAVGTQATQIVASSVTGALAHFARNSIDFKMGSVLLAGGITLGIMQQIIRAFGRVEGSFQYLVNSWTTIVELMSIYKRLQAFEATLRDEPLPEIEREASTEPTG